MDNGGLRYGAVEGALRPPLRIATHRPSHPTLLLALRGPKVPIRLTDPLRRNIIASIRGSERWLVGFRLELVAGFVGIRTLARQSLKAAVNRRLAECPEKGPPMVAGEVHVFKEVLHQRRCPKR